MKIKSLSCVFISLFTFVLILTQATVSLAMPGKSGSSDSSDDSDSEDSDDETDLEIAVLMSGIRGEREIEAPRSVPSSSSVFRITADPSEGAVPAAVCDLFAALEVAPRPAAGIDLAGAVEDRADGASAPAPVAGLYGRYRAPRGERPAGDRSARPRLLLARKRPCSSGKEFFGFPRRDEDDDKDRSVPTTKRPREGCIAPPSSPVH